MCAKFNTDTQSLVWFGEMVQETIEIKHFCDMYVDVS